MLSKLIYDTEQISQVSMDAVTVFIQSLFMVIGCLVVMFVISPILTLLYILLIPLIALVIIFSVLVRKSKRNRQAELNTNVGGVNKF